MIRIYSLSLLVNNFGTNNTINGWVSGSIWDLVRLSNEILKKKSPYNWSECTWLHVPGWTQ